MSMTIGEPPHVSQPKQVQLRKSYSPPNLIQRLAKVVLHWFVPALLKQHKPDPFGLVPIGQAPLKAGVVQLLPAVASAQL